jgi:tetratricopeptide (TPR) repeat protein
MKVALLVFTFLIAACTEGFGAERWSMVKTASLTVIGDQSPGALRDIADRLERFRVGVAALIHDADRPIPLPTVVFVFGARKSIQPFLPLARDGRPAAFAGYFHRDGDVNYIALSLEGFDDNLPIVFHEYTHLLVRNAVRSVPIWLNEGLAEYYSTFALTSGGKTAEIGRPIVSHVRLLRERYLPLSELITVDLSSQLYDEGVRQSIFYAEAWALTHYLMVEVPEGPAAINRYVAELAAGSTPALAFRNAFGTTPEVFDEQLRRYLAHPEFRSRTYAVPDRLRKTVVDAGRILPTGEADAWLGDLQRRVHRTPEATTRIEQAFRVATDSAMAHLALGLLRLDEGRVDEAWPVLDEAAALAPDDFMIQFAYGMSLLRYRAQQYGQLVDRAALERSRTALMRATELNPMASDAYAWLAYAGLLRPDSLPDAHAAIVRAIALSPGRLDFRLRYADIQILEGSIEDARAQLTELAALTTDSTIADRATQRLAALPRKKS